MIWQENRKIDQKLKRFDLRFLLVHITVIYFWESHTKNCQFQTWKMKAFFNQGKKFWQLQFRFIINHLMKHIFKTYWPFSVPAGLGLPQQFPNEILHFRSLCYISHGRTHYWKNTRFRLLFLPVVFSLRPTAAQNKKKKTSKSHLRPIKY